MQTKMNIPKFGMKIIPIGRELTKTNLITECKASKIIWGKNMRTKKNQNKKKLIG